MLQLLFSQDMSRTLSFQVFYDAFTASLSLCDLAVTEDLGTEVILLSGYEEYLLSHEGSTAFLY